MYRQTNNTLAVSIHGTEYTTTQNLGLDFNHVLCTRVHTYVYMHVFTWNIKHSSLHDLFSDVILHWIWCILQTLFAYFIAFMFGSLRMSANKSMHTYVSSKYSNMQLWVKCVIYVHTYVHVRIHTYVNNIPSPYKSMQTFIFVCMYIHVRKFCLTTDRNLLFTPFWQYNQFLV